MSAYTESGDPVKPASLWGYALRWGLIGTGISAVAGLLLYVADMGTNRWLAMGISLITFIAVLYLCAKSFRDESQNGLITFGKAYGVSAATSLVMAIGTAVWTLIFMGLIAPDFLEQIKEMQLEQMVEMGMEEDQARKSMEDMAFFFKPGTMAIMGIINTMIFGAVIGLVTSAIVQKK